MSLKLEYIRTRKRLIESNLKGKFEVDLNFFYNYFMLKSKKVIDPQTFQFIFLQGDFQEIIKHLDKEYELSILYSKEGVELMVIE